MSSQCFYFLWYLRKPPSSESLLPSIIEYAGITHWYNEDNSIWRNDEISLIFIFSPLSFCNSDIEECAKLPATVAMIKPLVKVQRDLSSAFVNLDSAGIDKIAQVMEFLRANVSPHLKSDSKKDLIFLSLIKTFRSETFFSYLKLLNKKEL